MKDTLQLLQITVSVFQISDFSLLFEKAAVDTDTEYSFVFSIQLFSFVFALTVDS